MQNKKLLPIATDQQPAPNHLLQLVRCGCKTDCASKRCTCKKHGLECTVMCGECKDTSCLNSTVIQELEATEED